jgi:hypothetical protein
LNSIASTRCQGFFFRSQALRYGAGDAAGVGRPRIENPAWVAGRVYRIR